MPGRYATQEALDRPKAPGKTGNARGCHFADLVRYVDEPAQLVDAGRYARAFAAQEKPPEPPEPAPGRRPESR